VEARGGDSGIAIVYPGLSANTPKFGVMAKRPRRTCYLNRIRGAGTRRPDWSPEHTRSGMNDERSNPGEAWYDRTIVDHEGAKIGKIADVYFDNDSQRPEWALVHTGLFGTRETIVPIAGASTSGDDLVVPYEKSFVKDAPNVGSDEELSHEDEARLAEYYGLQYSGRSPNGTPNAGPDRGGDDGAMTRSEEELQVGSVRRPSELVRLKKRVVTEQQQVTVPVQREEVVVEREPITDANRAEAMSGAEISEAEHAVTLHQEEVVVEKSVVPKERVRLGKDISTSERTVDETLRKEQIEIERDPVHTEQEQ
jgi:uncharacterized protein (TIGR02271 family)